MKSATLSVGLAVGVLAAVGCGGAVQQVASAEPAIQPAAPTSEATLARQDELVETALTGLHSVAGRCTAGNDVADLDGKVDQVADAFRASGWSSAIRSVVRLTAASLRDCGDQGHQAIRLTRLAADH